jgi:hypothetical protein
MGVACDVKDPVSWTSPAVPNRDQGDYFEYLGASGYMPERVADWYGWFEMDNPVVIDDNGELHTLSQLNDIEHYTFKQIAAALRRTYLVDTGSQDG